MRWSKIKNIIIVLLIIVNLALLALVGSQAWHSRANERLARERMLTILENNNIAFLPGEIPGEMALEPAQVSAVASGVKEAGVILGEVTGWETMGTRTVYRNGEGSVTASPAGELEVQFTRGTLNEEAVTARLNELGVWGRELSREAQEDTVTVVWGQLWGGVIVPDERVVMTYRSGMLESMTLRRLAESGETQPAEEETITAATALMRFLESISREGYVCSQVTDLYAGYSVSGSGTVRLAPVWYVETDTHQRFAVDGYTGAVSITE